MSLRTNRRKNEIPSWVGYVGDMKTPQDVLSSKKWLSGWFPVKFLNSFLRSLGAIAFANNPLTGTLIFLGMCVGNIEVALASLLGGSAAFLTSKILSVDNGAICDGVPMFNSILVGSISAAVAPTVFDTPLNATLWCGITVTAVITVFIDQGLISMMAPSKLPAQSVPFNFVIVVLMIIVGMHRPSEQPSDMFTKDITNGTGDASQWDNHTDGVLLSLNVTSNDDIDWGMVWHGVLLSSGQIYGVGTATPSVFIWLAFALCSPFLTVVMACGAIIGSLFGALVATNVLPEVYQGLWGYNSLLAAGGIVYFNVPSPASVLAALVNAIVAACVQIALLPLFSTTGMPVFSYPFNVAIMLILAISLRKESPLIFVTDSSFPELQFYKCYKDLDQEEIISNIEGGMPLNKRTGNDL